jgi:hypothetical protein
VVVTWRYLSVDEKEKRSCCNGGLQAEAYASFSLKHV